MPILDQRVTLSGGRKLGYDEHGDRGGLPLLYFHGTPSARVEWEFWGADAVAASLGLRIIAVDRPGMGLSDFQHGRHIGDWPADVGAFADALGLERFGVLGFSGGTPYALACALKLADRLTSVGLVGAEAPFSTPGVTEGISPASLQFLELNRDKPLIARAIQRVMVLTARFAPDKLIAQAMDALPQPDCDVLSKADARAAFLRMVVESTRKGTRGPQVDTALMVSAWDFDPADIRIPVHIWQGEKDADAPPAMARFIGRTVPQATLAIYPEEGHLSVLAHHAEEILTTFVA